VPGEPEKTHQGVRARVLEEGQRLRRDLTSRAAARLKPPASGPNFTTEPLFRSTIPHSPTAKASALVVACSSYLYLRQTQEFLFGELNLESYDLVAVPGGVQWLALPDILPKHNRAARWAAEYLIREHDLHRVICVAHQDCSAYEDRSTLGAMAHIVTGKSVFEHQAEQLKAVGRNLTESFGVAAELYYASVADGAVVFHRITQP
jgi:hypothetical protein